MGFASLALLLDKGTPVILLALLIMSVVNTVSIRYLFLAIRNKLWSETYKSDQNTQKAITDALDARVARLEATDNGK